MHYRSLFHHLCKFCNLKILVIIDSILFIDPLHVFRIQIQCDECHRWYWIVIRWNYCMLSLKIPIRVLHVCSKLKIPCYTFDIINLNRWLYFLRVLVIWYLGFWHSLCFTYQFNIFIHISDNYPIAVNISNLDKSNIHNSKLDVITYIIVFAVRCFTVPSKLIISRMTI